MKIIREEKTEIRDIEVHDSLEEFLEYLKVYDGRYNLQELEKFEKTTIQGVDVRTRFVSMYTSSSKLISSTHRVFITEEVYQGLLFLSTPVYTLADELYDEDVEEIYIRPTKSIEEAQGLVVDALTGVQNYFLRMAESVGEEINDIKADPDKYFVKSLEFTRTEKEMHDLQSNRVFSVL